MSTLKKIIAYFDYKDRRFTLCEADVEDNSPSKYLILRTDAGDDSGRGLKILKEFTSLNQAEAYLVRVHKFHKNLDTLTGGMQ